MSTSQQQPSQPVTGDQSHNRSQDEGIETVRVAIIGSGLTGLVATYLLSSDLQSSSGDNRPTKRICVEIFERASTLGMDSASISVPLESIIDSHNASSVSKSDSAKNSKKQSISTPHHAATTTSPPSRVQVDPETGKPSLRIDVPMRAFTGGYYPQLLALYNHLGIRTAKSNFTYSFATALQSSFRELADQVPDHSTTKHSSTKQTSSSSRTPQPSILYNGANGMRGIGIPSSLRQSSTSFSPLRLQQQYQRFRSYLSNVLVLVLGYLQLLIIAMWHHKSSNLRSHDHPIRSYTLRQLVSDPFPSSPSPSPSSSALSSFSLFPSPQAMLTGLLFRPLYLMTEAILRRCIRLDPAFVHATLVPLFSAVMTCSNESVWQSPATQILEYVALTLGQDHFVVKDGVRNVVAALLTHLKQPLADADTVSAQDSECVDFNPQSSKGRVWVNAEVQNVKYDCKDGKVYLDVLHHSPTVPSCSPRSPIPTPLLSSLPATQPMQRHDSHDSAISSSSSLSTASSYCPSPSSSVSGNPLSSSSSTMTHSTTLENEASIPVQTSSRRSSVSTPSVRTRTHGGYHHIILATQANQSAQFLRQYLSTLTSASASASAAASAASSTNEESSTGAQDATTDLDTEVHRIQGMIDTLCRFKYEKSCVVNHTDPSLLPGCKDDWRDLNLVTMQPAQVLEENAIDLRRDSATSTSTSGSSAGSDWTTTTTITTTDDLSKDTGDDERHNNAIEKADAQCPTDGIIRETASEIPTLSPTKAGHEGAFTRSKQNQMMQQQQQQGQYQHTMATHILHLGPLSSPLLTDKASLQRTETEAQVGRSMMMVMQTTNPLPNLQPNPGRILSKTYFERAVLDVPSHLGRSKLFRYESNRKTELDLGLGLGLGELHLRHHPSRSHRHEQSGTILVSDDTNKQSKESRESKEDSEGNERESEAVMPGIWCAGSYATGIPLLEGCVTSATLIAQTIVQLENLTFPKNATWNTR